MSKIEIGRTGENAAAKSLADGGYIIIEQNYRSAKWGELDLICLEGGDLVFVEVKTRNDTQYGQAIEAVSWGKRQRLLRAAQYYKLTHPQTPDSLRFDVVTVQSVSGTSDLIQIYKNIDHG